MTPEENKALIRRFYEEVWNRRRYDAAADFFASDSVRHEASGPVRGGAEGIARNAAAWCAAFPDTRYTVEDVIAEGDRVLTRWTLTGTQQGEFMGIAPTGRQIRVTGMSLDIIEDGMIVEGFDAWDALGLRQQLGAL